MSYHNYYYPQQKKKLSYSTVLYYSLLVVATIIIIHIIWAYFVNRYSSDRIGNALVKKFVSIHNSDTSDDYKETEVQFTDFDFGVMSADKSTASTNIQMKNKESRAILKQRPFSLAVNSDCASTDFSCVNL